MEKYRPGMIAKALRADAMRCRGVQTWEGIGLRVSNGDATAINDFSAVS